jgi:hypothetical protein
VVTYLEANEEECLRLKQRIIAKHRVEKGLRALPPDGFLLDWNAYDNISGVEGISMDGCIPPAPVELQENTTTLDASE